MSQVDEIEQAIDIVELVKRYTTLKKAWANYKALCPFPGHNEKTASFVVSPSKQLAYCFGCHRWWWPFKFIMDIENTEFKDALEILSSITGIKLKWYDRETEELKKNIYTLMRDITNFYSNSLQNNPQILKYLSDRGINRDSIGTFKLWYASWGIELYNYLLGRWYDDELIAQSDVFSNLSAKRDKFIGRLMFPIIWQRWDIVGFGGRIISSWEPKYLNSPSSLIYDKSKTLYGLFQSRSTITKLDYIVITEWYLDTISLYQAWYTNVVSVSGTALTERHIEVIKRLTHKIYLCLDGDNAGQNAIKLAIDMLKNKDLEVKIIRLPDGRDPDDVIKSGDDFSQYINRALTPIWYHLEYLQEIEWLQDKKELLRLLLNLTKNYKDNIEVDYYLKEISKRLDVSLDIIYQEYQKTKIDKREWITKLKSNTISSEDLIIWYLINYRDKYDYIKEKIILIDYLWIDLKSILYHWLSIIDEFELSKKSHYIAISESKEMLKIKAQMDISNSKDQKNITQMIDKTIEKLNSDTLKIAKKELTKNISMWDRESLIRYQELLKYK